ncbi:unnamed protein product, partial [Angiostrongylus costaricensis]|uniref:Pkinase_fungal domain-containing protein n=1 Tax=Angiostrongylus costaricensis TaxID=334426 RepID=A0A0R3Q276_ANGCS
SVSVWDGFILDPRQLIPTGRETWAGIKVVIEAVLNLKQGNVATCDGVENEHYLERDAKHYEHLEHNDRVDADERTKCSRLYKIRATTDVMHIVQDSDPQFIMIETQHTAARTYDRTTTPNTAIPLPNALPFEPSIRHAEVQPSQGFSNFDQIEEQLKNYFATNPQVSFNTVLLSHRRHTNAEASGHFTPAYRTHLRAPSYDRALFVEILIMTDILGQNSGDKSSTRRRTFGHIRLEREEHRVGSKMSGRSPEL